MDPTAPVSIEELLVHREWVRALARTLVVDPNAADDVEQDAWLAALRHPPRHGDGIRGWIAALVRHRAFNAARAARRRSAREDAVRSDRPTDDPAEAVARMEAHERVVRAVLSLPEPYRTTIVLRFYEGLSGPEIARRTGVPLETARTRVKRAIERMRRQLDDEQDGDRGAWCAALLPLALGAGGAAMKTSAKVAVVASLLLFAAAGGVAWSLRRWTPETERGTTTVAASTAPRAAKRAAAQPVESPAEVASVVGEARSRADGRPVVGGTVALLDVAGRRVETTTDADGRFAFAALAAGRAFDLHADSPSLAAAPRRVARLSSRETRDVGVVWLDAVGGLEVTVACASGSAEGATVDVIRPTSYWGAQSFWTSDDDIRDAAGPAASARVAATGVASFRRVPAGRSSVVVRREGCVPGVLDYVDVPEGGVAKASIVLERAARFEGRLVDGARRPIPRRRVFGRAESAPFGFVGTLARAEAETDGDGRFALDGLRPGPTCVVVATDAGDLAVATQRAPTAGVVEIVLERRAVAGVVTEKETGRPVAAATVRALFGASAGTSPLRATTDAEGRYELDAFVDGTFNDLSAEAPGFGPVEALAVRVASGATSRADLHVARTARVEGTVVADGRPVIGAEVHVTWFDGQSNLHRRDAETDAAGRYAAADVHAGRLVAVQVVARGLTQKDWDRDFVSKLMGRGEASPAWSVRTTPGATVRLDVEMVGGRTVAGRVEDAAGAPIVGAGVYGGSDRTISGADGAFRLLGVPNGKTTLVTAWADGFVGARATLDTTTDVEGARLVMTASPRLRGVVRTVDGGPRPDGAVVRVVPDEWRGLYGDEASQWRTAKAVRVRDDGSFDAAIPVDHGGIRVRAEAPGFAQNETTRIDVVAGKSEYETSLVLVPMARLEGRIVDSTDGHALEGAEVSVDFSDPRASGPVAPQPHFVRCAVAAADGSFMIADLAPATWRGQATANGHVAQKFEIALPATEPLVLRVEPAVLVASGFVRDADGRPVAAASVASWPDDNPSGVDQPWTSTDADGKFELRGPTIAGTWTVATCPPPGGKYPSRWVKLPGVAAGRTDVELVLSVARRIAGHVFASDGAPVRGVQVRANSRDRKSSNPHASTDDAGAFAIEGADDAVYDVSADAPSERRDDAWTSVCRDLPTTVTGVKAGAEDVVIRLDAGDVVSGVLVGEDGRPVAGAWLIASPPRGQVETRARPGYYPCGGLTDAAGKFGIGGLGHGRCRVTRVERASYSADPVFTPLAGGEDVASDASGLTLRVPPLASIDGKVVDEDGAGVAGARVEATLGTPNVVASAMSAADGTFRFARLDAGRQYVLRVSKSGAFVPTKTDDVAPGATGVIVKVQRGLRAAGRALDADGKPLRPAVLRFRPEGGGDAFEVSTDKESRFDVWGLAAGTYVVEAVVAQTQAGRVVHGTATIAAGDRDVDLRFRE